MKITPLKLVLAAGLLGVGLAALPYLSNAIPNGSKTSVRHNNTTYNVSDSALLHKAAFRPSRVRDELRQDGWRNIVFVDRSLPVYVVRACRGDRKFELRLNRFGKINRQRELGRCRVASNDDPGRKVRLSVPDIRRVLVGLGYKSIKFRDRELPVYVADACKRRVRYRMRINRRGDINFRERIGRCRRDGQVDEGIALRPRQIQQIVEGLGFNRVSFTDRELPTYIVEACKNNRKVELRLNRRGDVRSRRNIGSCREIDGENVLTVQEVGDVLRKRRYYRIRFTDRQLPWYGASACRSRKEFDLLLNRWGDIRRRRQTGVCEAPQRGEIVAVAPRRRVNIEELRTRRRIDADECQDYLESLLEDNTINFAVASAKIEEESFDLLERLAFVATRCPETNVEIAGHTDSDGSRNSNQDLSEKRAKSVVDFLTRRDVARNRLTAAGYGEDRPIASNASSSGKAKNRRIEFVVTWGS